ncbi:hypothetical protein CALVIDRAFT_563123 [Calocera viscosa TUFC12733]|uniref:BTB domain-containing protein n=1 Tax=Calocera viscosa (strain TUFC12733) TaxID=1330018 RepID=A0A167N4B7_CALVF|nr:hypothetical protein CALVIDRAFT_563123 [Calocera viscosa TUFC12733]
MASQDDLHLHGIPITDASSIATTRPSSRLDVVAEEFPLPPPLFGVGVEDADVILRGKDDVDLYAHAIMLKRASPVFASSLSELVPEVPVLNIDADGRTIDTLLQYIYPDCRPEVGQDFDAFLGVLQLAVVYQVGHVMQLLRKMLVQPDLLHAYPIRIYAAATRWRFNEEADIAAEATGKLDLAQVGEKEVGNISATDLVKLMARHRRRKGDILEALKGWKGALCKTCQGAPGDSWSMRYYVRASDEIKKRPGTDVIFSEEFINQEMGKSNCPECDNYFALSGRMKDLKQAATQSMRRHSPSYSRKSVQSTASAYSPPLVVPSTPQMENIFSEGDCILRSIDSQDIRVYRRILIEASHFWKHLFSLPQSQPDVDPRDPESAVPIVDCTERGRTLKLLLQLIYPVPKPQFRTFAQIEPVLEAAHKFEMDAALQHLAGILREPHFIQLDPVRVYALACRYDLPDLARLASSFTLRSDLEQTAEESVFGLSAAAFLRLLQFRDTRASQITSILTERAPPSPCEQCKIAWASNWLRLALEEIRRRPVSDVIFSLSFVTKSFDVEQVRRSFDRIGYHQCNNIFNIADHDWLQELKKKIDQLPESLDP